MAKKVDANVTRNAAREAKEHGVSPSAAGATTGASKQIDTKGHENGPKDHKS
jgi:hypothetical protein